MEPQAFAFVPIAKGYKHPKCQRTFCRVLSYSGANPLLKSYTTILQWFVDGYNMIEKKNFHTPILLYLLWCIAVW